MFTITRITAVGAVLALAVTAGASLAGPPAKPSSVTLTLETPSGPGRPATNLAEAFAERVKALSDGAIVVKVRVEDPSFKAPEQKAWPYQRRHVDNVTSGRVDLATVWTQTLEYAGIGTARALHVPFLITSKAAATRATSGATASSIMAGFEKGGLVGLTLSPQGLGRLFSAGRPLASAADLAGARIRTPYAPTSPTALKALGARPIDANGGMFTAALGKGSIRANEIVWDIASVYLTTSKTAGNVVLSPQVNAVVANAASWRRLSDAQQKVLRQAAVEARTTMVARWDERREARTFCTKGGTIVNASAAALARLEAGAASAEEALTRDAATRAVVRAIRAQGSAEIDRIAPCAGPAAQPPAGGGAGVTTLPPSGSYRLVLKPATMRAAGADENNIRNNSGTHTLAIDGAKMGETGRNPSHSFFCAYSLKVVGPFVRVTPDPASECAGDPWHVKWKLDGKDLILTWFDGNRRSFTTWEKLWSGRWEHVG